MRRGIPFPAARDAALGPLAPRDRRLAHELAAGVLRQQRALDAAVDLARADPRLHDLLRLGAYQLRHLSRVPAYAAVSTTVALARERAGAGAARYVNQALRRLAQEEVTHRTPRTTHPPWLVERWRVRFGPEATDRLLVWNDTRPPLILQPARWDQDTLAARLRHAGITTVPAPFNAGRRLVRAASGTPLPTPRLLPGYLEGGFIVQDPAHALVCRFAAIPADRTVYDACAAPGGKAVTLEMLGARVVAADGRRERLARLVESVRRAGRAIRCVAADLHTAPFRPGSWDAVLLDAPCTATGTIARHPDARGRLAAAGIAKLAARQRVLLDAAAPLVRRGGVLVYATCSLEPEENADQVSDFLTRHPDYARAPVAGSVPAEVCTAAGDFASLPQEHGIDGAYAARLMRVR